MEAVLNTTHIPMQARTEELKPAHQRPVDGQHAVHPEPFHDVPDTAENRDKVESAVRVLEAMNGGDKVGKQMNRFRIQMHEATGKIQVSLVNYMTGEVIETIPSSKMIEFSARMQELTGLVLDKRG